MNKQISTSIINTTDGTARVWTAIYRPFTMGGNVDDPFFTIIKFLERRKIKQFEFFSFETPSKTIKVCEAQTGGIIANSFEELKENIKGCSKGELQAQINSAKVFAEQAKEMSNEEFFKFYKY